MGRIEWDEWNEEKRKVRDAKEKDRMTYAANMITDLGYPCRWDQLTKCLSFEYKGATVKFFPFTGWHTGKTIKDGRGLNRLLKQIKV